MGEFAGKAAAYLATPVHANIFTIGFIKPLYEPANIIHFIIFNILLDIFI